MSDLSAEEVAIARQFDLTQKVIPFFDRHLLYPILESLRDVYDDRAITKLTYDLFKDTNMTGFLKEQWKLLEGNENYSKEILDKDTQIEKTLAQLSQEAQKTLDVLNKQEVQEDLKQDKLLNQEYLAKNHNITEEDIDKLYEFGQFQYNRGDYVMASDLLANFRALSTSNEKVLNATWGKFACEILRTEWDAALKELAKLREIVDSRSFGEPLTQLHSRTWVIHWSLFPFFNIENGLESLVDLYFSSSYLSTIQAACPWILRYLVAAVVASESSTKNNLSNPAFQKRLKELIGVVGQEQYEYNDPLTSFYQGIVH
ncbi:Eukaryotic translation initiation factor 3 subunit E [Cyberlindnera fabianii]|uniref:Eukaryotic translation initiation factor 3 subunit E n=1 Tax=Cyberlindnera fabianii TaxID=36022 RepID=A0A1V2L0M7_CYBFA|nr:Eukaryotic translation initiation factor 3 subunit E [Cyberlindnera fabianii]